MGRLNTRGIALILLLVVPLALVAVPASASLRRVRDRRIGPGVRYSVYRQRKPPLRARVVSMRLDSKASLGVVLGSGTLPGYERTSSMARRHGAIAAINGDYARLSGRPVMTFAQNGELAQTPLTWGRNFAVSYDERDTYIGHPKVGVWASAPSIGLEQKISRVNEGRPGLSQVALYTPTGGTLERPPKRACSARLYRVGAARVEREGTPVVEATYEVDRAWCSSRRMPRRGGVVMAASRRSRRAPAISSLRRSQRIALAWSVGWEGVIETLGGNPTLIEKGNIVVGRSSHPFFMRNPRTGVGTTPKGRVLLVAVDGRRRKYSRGMTLRGLAGFFRRLGATWALNLDGGGSTTMVVRGRVTNRPSDGSERPVSSALLVLPRPRRLAERLSTTASRESTAVETTHLPAIEPAEVWPKISQDPASTGGLAASLEAGGERLPRPLTAAARAFTSRRPGR